MTTYRSLATVLFTDIVGSTEKAAELGDHAWGELLHRYFAIVEREVREQGGEVSGRTGDGAVALFHGPSPAILAAWAIQDAVGELGLEIRTGLHMGEVGRAGEEIEGIGVHIGARVAAAARSGEILVSSTVHDAEAGSGFRFEDRGVHHLKGVPGEWRLYALAELPPVTVPLIPRRLYRRALGDRGRVVVAAALVLAGIAGYLLLGDRGDLAPPDVEAVTAEPGIAILPFTVNDPELSRWREGLVDLMSTNLDGVAGLRAINSRTVLSRWRQMVPENGVGDLETALEVARETGAHYGVMGSVVSSGPDLRLVAELYDLREGGRSLGQKQVQGAQDSIFVLIDRLSIAVLGRIMEEEEEGGEIPSLDLSRITTSSLPALKAYLEGEVFHRRSRFSDAAEAYERAVAADSTFALAWFRLSDASGWRESFQGTQGMMFQALDRAWDHSERLPERERRLIEIMRMPSHSDFTRLSREFAQSYPDDVRAWYQLGEALFHSPHQSLASRSDREEPFLRATRLDPLYSPAHIHLLDLAFIFADSGVVARRLSEFERGAAGSVFDRQFRLAYGLGFSDPATRAKTLAALDTVSTTILGRATELLGHPRLLKVQQSALEELVGRPDVPPATGQDLLFRNALAQGKIRRAIQILGSLPADTEPFFWGLNVLHVLPRSGLVDSLPLRPEFLADASVPPSPDERITPGRFYWVATSAVDRGRRDDYERAIESMNDAIQTYIEEGDSLEAVFRTAVLTSARGYEAAARGRIDDGGRLAEEAYRAGFSVGPTVLRLLVRTRGHKEALEYAEAMDPDPVVGALAAPVFERTGQREQALVAWGWVLQAWGDADPELHPRVAEARQAIARLNARQRS